MGMFNRFKKNTEVSAPESELPHSALFRALDKLKKTQDPTAMAELSRVLKAYVDDGTWVPMPVVDAPNGYQLRFIESKDKLYSFLLSLDLFLRSPFLRIQLHLILPLLCIVLPYENTS